MSADSNINIITIVKAFFSVGQKLCTVSHLDIIEQKYQTASFITVANTAIANQNDHATC